LRARVFGEGAVALGAIAATGALAVAVGTRPGVAFALLVAGLAVATVGAHVLVVRTTGDSLSLLSMAAGFYFAAFVVGGIFLWFKPAPADFMPVFSRGSIVSAVIVALVGWVLFVTGYRLGLFRPLQQILPPFPDASGARVPVVVTLLVFGWGARASEFAGGTYFHDSLHATSRNGASWFLDALADLPLVALAYVAAIAYGARTPGRRAALVLLAAVELAWAVPTGSKFRVVSIAVILLVVRYYATRKLPSIYTSLALLGVVIFVLFPFARDYRSMNYQTSPKLALSVAARDTLDRGVMGNVDVGFASLGRISDLAAIARIIYVGRERLGLRPGETYLWSLQGVFPRAIYPDKADPGQFGNTFGRAFGFISPSDYKTAIAATQLGEFYLNGGWLALLLGLPLLGGLYRLLNDYLGSRWSDPGALAVYAVVAVKVLLSFENIVAIGIVGIVKSTIFYTLILALIPALFTLGRPLAQILPAPTGRP